jgi:hypothetical protein
MDYNLSISDNTVQKRYLHKKTKFKKYTVVRTIAIPEIFMDCVRKMDKVVSNCPG